MSDSESILDRATTYVSEFGNALVYSAVQSPYEGARQLAAHCGADILPQISLVDAPRQSETGSTAWYGQQFGGAIGTAIDYMILAKVAGSLSGAASVSSEAVAGQSLLNCAGRTVASNAALGGAFDFVCRPVADNQPFWSTRIANAGMGAFTTVLVGGTDIGLQVVASKTASTVLKDTAIRGALGGGITGVASSVVEKGGFDTTDALHKGLAFAGVGCLFGLRSSGLFATAERPSIPAHEASGYLPIGEHEASWSDFQTRFATNEHRQDLLPGLHEALTALKSAGGERVYIGGSYVTAKERPGDIDVCWSTVGVDRKKLSAIEPIFDATSAEQKAKLGVDLFPNAYHMDRDLFTSDLFQISREKTAVGVVTLKLATLPAVLSPTKVPAS